MTKNNELEEGAVGYVIANIKDASEIQIGDTLTNSKNPSTYPHTWVQRNTSHGFS